LRAPGAHGRKSVFWQGCMEGFKFQIPNSKFQKNSKLQIPNWKTNFVVRPCPAGGVFPIAGSLVRPILRLDHEPNPVKGRLVEKDPNSTPPASDSPSGGLPPPLASAPPPAANAPPPLHPSAVP